MSIQMKQLYRLIFVLEAYFHLKSLFKQYYCHSLVENIFKKSARRILYFYFLCFTAWNKILNFVYWKFIGYVINITHFLFPLNVYIKPIWGSLYHSFGNFSPGEMQVLLKGSLQLSLKWQSEFYQWCETNFLKVNSSIYELSALISTAVFL